MLMHCWWEYKHFWKTGNISYASAIPLQSIHPTETNALTRKFLAPVYKIARNNIFQNSLNFTLKIHALYYLSTILYKKA